MARKRNYDVFVVSSYDDKGIVVPIVVKLRTVGYKCRISMCKSGKESLPFQSIKASSVIVFFSSESCNNIELVRKEIEVAIQLKKPIVHVRLDDSSCCVDLLAQVKNVIVSHFGSDSNLKTIECIVSALNTFNIQRNNNPNADLDRIVPIDSDKVIVGAASEVAATIGSATCAPIAAVACVAPCTLLGVIAGVAHGIKKCWDFLGDDVVERMTGEAYGSKKTKSCYERPFVIDRQNMTTGQGKKVFSSVFAPAEIVKNSHLLVQVYLHTAEEIEDISCSAKEAQRDASRRGQVPLVCPLQIGNQVDVVLNIYGQKLIDTQMKSIVWQGSFVNCTFQYFITSKTKLKDVCCEVLLFMKNVPIGEMLFTVEIVDVPKSLPAEVTTRRFKKVFISYAHQDESRVRFMARGFKKLGVDYFFDRDYLKAGDVFPVIIQEYINTADLFILFWSENAAKSEYVVKELSQALELAFPKIKPPEKAPLSICAYSIEPKAELPASMRNDYNFEEI